MRSIAATLIGFVMALGSGAVVHSVSHLLAAGLGAGIALNFTPVGLFLDIAIAVAASLLFLGLLLVKIVVSISTILVFIGMPLAVVFSLPLSMVGGGIVAGVYWISVGSLLYTGELVGREVQVLDARLADFIVHFVPRDLRVYQVATLVELHELPEVEAGHVSAVAVGLAAVDVLRAVGSGSSAAEGYSPSPTGTRATRRVDPDGSTMSIAQ